MNEHVPHADPDAPQLAVLEHAEHDGTVRETLESVVIAFVLAFAFRAFIVEAFIIPTGSMAPTLLGEHIRFQCPQCGYSFVTDPKDKHPGPDGRDVADPIQGIRLNEKGQSVGAAVEVDCPMCDYRIVHDSLPAAAGDRILVLKYIYALSEPQRGDVVVFKNPQDPTDNFIKRLVGRPCEEIRILDGNVYWRPLDQKGAPGDPNAPWKIWRKAERLHVQNEVWQPIYHSDFYPQDGGEMAEDSLRKQTWSVPWRPIGPSAAQWQLERGLRWRFGGEGESVARLRFAFRRDHHFSKNYYPYNLFDRADAGFDSSYEQNYVGEMRLAISVQPEQPLQELTLTLGGRTILVRGRVDEAGNAIIETAARPESRRRGFDDQAIRWTERMRGHVGALAVGRGTRMELWHVDQSVWLWVGGKVAAGPWNYELGEVGLEMDGLNDQEWPLPIAEVGAVGGPFVLRSLDLDRDLYYTQGGLRATHGNATMVGPDQFFVLGDNSPASDDGRAWNRVDPWVDSLHDVPPGFVPRELMLGRAFFVYFPATLPVQGSPIGVVNFGKMRYIR